MGCHHPWQTCECISRKNNETRIHMVGFRNVLLVAWDGQSYLFGSELFVQAIIEIPAIVYLQNGYSESRRSLVFNAP